MQRLAHMFDHGGEEVEHFWVARVLRIRLVVVNEQLERGQELLVEDCVALVRLLQYVGLDKLEDVAPHGLHWFDHGVVLRLLADD